MNKRVETLTGLHAYAWDIAAKAREVSFATVSQDGWPAARIVILRGTNPDDATLTVHTDRFSQKITALRDNPRATILIWNDDAQVQLRMQAEVFIQTGQSVAAQWARVPDPSRQSYGTTPPPGTPIADALDYTKPCDPAAFCVLHCQVVDMDVVHLGDVHRRAQFTRARDWAGQWLSP